VLRDGGAPVASFLHVIVIELLRFISREGGGIMRKLKVFLCVCILLDVLAGYVSLVPVPGALAQGVPNGITYVTAAQNWSQAFTATLTGCPNGISCSTQTVTLSAGFSGVDTTTHLYQVYISDGTKSESVTVTGGNYTFASGGTIAFVPYFTHTLSYTFQSASSGIQETLNGACGTSTPAYANGYCNVTIPASGTPAFNNATYNVYGTIFLHGTNIILSGYGATLVCDPDTSVTGGAPGALRGPCIWNGPAVGISSNYTGGNTIQGITFRTPSRYDPAHSNLPAYYGSAITQTSCSSGNCTVTTSAAHGLHPGDLVDVNFTDNGGYWGDSIVATVPSSTTYTFLKGSSTVNLQTTPGVVALQFAAILDAGQSTNLVDIKYDYEGSYGSFNNFFDFWDDENATITHFNNNGSGMNNNGNWNSSFIYSGGNPIATQTQWAPVISLRDSTITANFSSGVTVLNSNGVYVENTVLQATGLWQVHTSNERGNYQGARLQNIYSESNISLNPPCSPSCPTGAKSPFPGVGVAGLIAGISTGAANLEISGGSSILSGAFQTGTTSFMLKSVTNGGVYTIQSGTFTNMAVNDTVSFTGWANSANNIAKAVVCSFTSTTISVANTAVAPCPTLAVTVSEMRSPPPPPYPLVSGSTPYSYFIVVNDTTTGNNPLCTQCQTSPMQVLNWNSTGSDLIPVHWPRVANGTDLITYDVIRIPTPVGIGATYPYTGGCLGGSFASCGYVAQGLLQATACNVAGVPTLVCTFIDNGTTVPQPHAINPTSHPYQGNYNGQLNFWPGGLVSVNKSVVVSVEQGPVVGVGLVGLPIQVAPQCSGYGGASPGGYTACLASITSPNNSVPNQTATILSDGDANTGGTQKLTKGRLNFTTTPFTTIQPHHIITLIDSEPALTQATSVYRPRASLSDTWIGTDVPSGGAVLNAGQLAFGAPVSITNYIAQTGDGINANWLERLSASMKEFTVPLQFELPNAVSLTSQTNECSKITTDSSGGVVVALPALRSTGTNGANYVGHDVLCVVTQDTAFPSGVGGIIFPHLISVGNSAVSQLTQGTFEVMSSNSNGAGIVLTNNGDSSNRANFLNFRACNGPGPTNCGTDASFVEDNTKTGKEEWLWKNGGADNPFYIGGLGSSHPGICLGGSDASVNSPFCLQYNAGHFTHVTRNAADADVYGSVTLSSGTASYTFNQAFASAPLCIATWQSATLTGFLKCATTTTGITVTSSVGTDNAVIAYMILGNNN
jgi:hypothetical protein